MSQPVIRLENVSKLYRIGEMGTGTISNDFSRWWSKMTKGNDPFAKIGQENIEREGDFWALKDINFEVNQGDVLGIIGKNGAGKSTLLKILSRITSPTSGQVKIKGRIASLLEVGTGFHPELTGRDNVYLNGSFLGMKKWEIDKRFEEIVEFSGIEKFIDTPVKRYSSGMYVRLAFAVAAHLDPEILIIDEVLAVGDAEFQAKCLGKMQDVSQNQGKTVIFVSHDMNAIFKLCTSAIVLKGGSLDFSGNTNDVVSHYLHSEIGLKSSQEWKIDQAPGNDKVKLQRVYSTNNSGQPRNTFKPYERIEIIMVYEVLLDGADFLHGCNLFNESGINVFNSHDNSSLFTNTKRSKGIYSASFFIEPNFLNEGTYKVGVAALNINPTVIHFHEEMAIAFQIIESEDENKTRGNYVGVFPGVVRPIIDWKSSKII